MQPAAVLSAIVRVQGIKSANVALGAFQGNLVKTDKAATAAGMSANKAGRYMAAGLGAGAVAAAFGLVKGVKAGAEFERRMDSFQSVSKATRRELKLVEKQALEFGENTVFSANDAAQASVELAKGGLTIKQIYGGALRSTLHLAAAGEMELADAAIISANAMKLFHLRGKDAESVADMLAIAANKTTADVYDFGMALKQGGSVARIVGYDLNNTVTVLEALAEAGIKNSDAGTSMKSALVQLITPSEKQAKLVKKLGIEWYNQTGEMKSAVGISHELNRVTEGMTKAERGHVLAILAGTDGIRTLNALYEAGPAKLKAMEKANEKAGYAAEVTATKTDNLKGDWEKLVNSAEVLGIKIEKFLNPILRDTVQFFTKLAKEPSKLKFLIKPAIVIATYLAARKIINVLRFLVTEQTATAAAVEGSNATIIASNDMTAASYAAVAAAAETSAAAQATAAGVAAKVPKGQLQMALPEAAAAGGQMSLLATPASAATASAPKAIEAEAAKSSTAFAKFGKTGAGMMVKSFGAFLPGAFAAIGVGNIISSVIEGDNKQAAFKGGGAIAGAVAGGLAFGLPGALVGAGIGSILGGELGKLFGAGKELHPLQEKLIAQSKTAGEAWKNQQAAAQGLSGAEGRLAQVKNKHREASKREADANRNLNEVVQKYGPVSRQAHRAELALARARRENTAAANGEKRAEQLTSNQQKLVLLRGREVVAHEKQRIPSIQETIKRLDARSNKEKNNIQVLQRLVNTEKKLEQSQGRIKRAIGDVAAIAPKQAQALRNMDSIQAQFGTNLRGLTDIYKAHKAQAYNSIAKVGQGWMDYRGTIHNSVEFGKKDIFSFTGATSAGLEITRKDLYKFAGELGIKNVKFGAKAAKSSHKGPKQQTGGAMEVPGAGTGDKVPMTAWVEPGEVVHVLNMKASKDRQKLGELEYANSMIPRHGAPKFQSGGMFVDPAGPGTGVVNKAIADVVGSWSQRYNAAINYGYDPGGGHISPGHNITGTATDTGPAAGWGAGPTKLFESGLRAIQGKVDQILYGSHGIGEAYPNHGWGNHAHIEWGMHPDVQAVLGQLVKKLEMTGPEGMLKDTGQAVLNAAVEMANKKLKQLGGMGGGADMNLQGIEGTVASQAAQIAKGTGSPHVSTLALFEALWAESSMGAASPGNVLQALPPYTKIMPAAQEISGFLTGHPEWTGTAAIPLASSGLPANAIAQLVQKSGVGEGNEGRANYLLQKENALNTMSQFGLQEGGILGGEYLGKLAAGSPEKTGGGTKKKKKDPFAKALHMVGGQHFKKGKAMVRKLNRRLEGMGFDPNSPMIKRLAELTTNVEKYDEFASSASSLTITEQNESTGEEEVFPGIFKGHDETFWLNEKLGSLLSLRKQLISGHGVVDKKVERTTKMIHEAKKRLVKIRKAIAKGEEQKREAEQKIKDLERARDEKVRQLEKEKKEIEQKLDKAQAAKNPNHDYINALREEIKSKTFAINHEGESARDGIKKENEFLRDLNKKQAGRRRVEDALANTLLPTLESKRTDLVQTGVDLYSSGGSVGALSYMGLQSVQGSGSTLDEVPNPPEIGMLGGEVFTTQNRLRELMAEKKKVDVKNTTKEEVEKLVAEAKLAEEMEWKKRFLTGQYQQQVLTEFPTVPDLAKIPGYALGGAVTPAWVGERGKELLFPAVGSRVVSHREATQITGDHQGGNGLVIESLVINEAEGTAEVTMGGETSIAKIKEVTRGQSRKSMAHTPGGTQR